MSGISAELKSVSLDESVMASAVGTQTAWYPSATPSEIPQASEELIAKTAAAAATTPVDRQLGNVHPIWQSGKVKYLTRNQWTPSIPQAKREACKRERPWGVEVRDLPKEHFLHGEQGLFAIAKFSKCDVVGEYTGKIVDSNVFGHYVAALEDKGTDESLGIDAQTCGNEMRFINSFLNIAFEPNVTLRTVYMGGMPHLLVICLRDIEIGEEFLLDYGIHCSINQC
jgi:hypothetical protein